MKLTSTVVKITASHVLAYPEKISRKEYREWLHECAGEIEYGGIKKVRDALTEIYNKAATCAGIYTTVPSRCYPDVIVGLITALDLKANTKKSQPKKTHKKASPIASARRVAMAKARQMAMKTGRCVTVSI